MRAGRLRHRVTIQSRGETRDADGGSVPAWVDFAVDVPAEFLSGPGREFLAAESIRAETVGRFQMRFLDGVTAAHRVLWNGKVWDIKAPPIVDRTAQREMTLLVGQGLTDG